MLEYKPGSQEISGLEIEQKTSMTVEMFSKSGWILNIFFDNITLNNRGYPSFLKPEA